MIDHREMDEQNISETLVQLEKKDEAESTTYRFAFLGLFIVIIFVVVLTFFITR